MERLPGEFLTEILIRLPAKSLAQLRCISKPWNALLSEPYFVKLHLHRSIHTEDQIFLVFYKHLSHANEVLTAHPVKSPNQKLTNFVKLPLDFPPNHFRKVIGSVNGLICFSSGLNHDNIHIWNPSLSAILTLPPHRNLLFCLMPSFFLGFGFDPKTDDYKVVMFTIHVGKPCNSSVYVVDSDNAIEECRQVGVFSFKKGSWELISHAFPSSVKHIPIPGVACVDSIDGHLLYWLLSDDDLDQPQLQSILAFDLCLGAFSETSIPESTVHSRNVLGFYAGKICLMACMIGGECEVWVMEEHGVAESWVKHSVFSESFGCRMPFGFTLRNEFVFEGPDDGLAVYDPNGDVVKSFDIRPYVKKVVPYVESLVWFAPRN